MERLCDYKYNDLVEVLEHVRIARQLFITKDGKPYCLEAEHLIRTFEEFYPYMWEDNAEIFKEEITKIIYSPLVPKPEHNNDPRVKKLIKENNLSLLHEFYQYKYACEVIDTFQKTNSWDEVYAKLKEQGHSGYSFSGLSNILIQYSPIGVEFIERFDPSRPLRDKTFKPFYDIAIERLKSPQDSPHPHDCLTDEEDNFC